MKPTLCLLTVALALVPLASEAKLVETARVRFQTPSGMSGWYSSDVTFMTGQELNAETQSSKYDGRYAIIFPSDNANGDTKADIITIDGFSACDESFEKSCLNGISNETGKDQIGRGWEICTESLCR